MFRHYLVLMSSVLLAACAAQSPPRTDPLADLVGNFKVIDSPTKIITEAKTKSIAIIVSTSADTQIKHREEMNKKYLDGYVRTFESGSYNAVKLQQESVGPRILIDTVVAALQQRFKSVTVVADLADFKEQSQDLAAIVDVGMEYGANSNVSKNSAEYTTEVSLILLDRQIRKIGIVNGKATEYWERSNVGDIKYLFNPFLASPAPDELMRPFVEAEKKSRASAFRLLNTSIDILVK